MSRRVQKDINVAQYEKTIQTAFREVADGLAARGTYDDEVAAVERYTAAQQSALDLSDHAVSERRRQLPQRAYGANRFVQRPADAGERRVWRASPTWSICTAPSAAGGSSTPAMRRVPPKMSGRSRRRAPHLGVSLKQVNSGARCGRIDADTRHFTDPEKASSSTG